jgi:hypothetical protein
MNTLNRTTSISVHVATSFLAVLVSSALLGGVALGLTGEKVLAVIEPASLSRLSIALLSLLA